MGADGTLLVHGGMCTARFWAPVMEHLARPAVAVDLPGRRARPAELAAVTLDDCVQTVIDAADEAGFEQVVLVAHSLGGVTITETAWRFPQRVKHLIYVAADVPAPGETAAIAHIGADWPPEQPVTIEENIARAMFGNDLTEDQWNEVWQQFVPDTPTLMNARVSGYPSGVPITYISMTDDIAVPAAMAKQMIANLGGNVEHREIVAGHLVTVSKPRELAAMINEVVDR
ncbi:alpha/beta fold hydrolase [Mycobacterium sp. 1423905.2]|uniref:alpha/beta fold hydrolase n=1 Tax=Mycobacterium sp. 1423905.2 TaxID=1856859 RepID=UPI00155FC86D|nr:alpha/beta hydrolase [Mycobacterium sp. 1423905.2]